MLFGGVPAARSGEPMKAPEPIEGRGHSRHHTIAVLLEWRDEIERPFCCAPWLRRGRGRTKSCLFLSSREEPAGLAASRIARRPGQVPEASAALRHSCSAGTDWSRTASTAAQGDAPAGFDRDTGRDRRGAGLEGRLVVGRQQRRRHHRRRPRHDAVREQRREQRHAARSRDWAGHHHSPRREHRRRPVAQQEGCAVPRVERIALGCPASAADAQGAGQLIPGRAARMRRWRAERPVGRQPRWRLRVHLGRRGVSTPTRKASSRSTEKGCRGPTASS